MCEDFANMLTQTDGYELGWGIKSIAKGAARGVASGAKGVAKGAKATAKGAVTVGKFAVNVALLPYKILLDFSLKAAKIVCQVPEPILVQAATYVGVSPNAIPLFCQAAQARDIGGLRRQLPAVIKIAVQVGATGAFPPIAPFLTAARMLKVPGLSGAEFGEEFGAAEENTQQLVALGVGVVALTAGIMLVSKA